MSNHQNEDTELCEQCRKQGIPGSLQPATKGNRSVSPLYWYIEGWPGVGPKLSSICSFCRLLDKVVALHEPLRREKIGIQWRVEVSPYGFLDLQSISQHKIRIERFQVSLEFRRPDENYWVVERKSQHNLQLASDGFNQGIFGRLGHNRPVPSRCDFSLFRDWIELCGNHHDTCRHVRYELDFPLRLIDVKRHCVVMAPSNSRYVALSYVWGTKKQLTLKNDTLQTFGTDGSLYENHQLPKTIKDAMTATRKLGERFLWVDALTIVPDDKQGKAIQIAKMGLIYSGAFLTIVAAAGDDSFAGLPGVESDSRNIQDNEAVVCGRKLSLLGMSICSRDEYLFSVGSSTWNSRGWTYQEKMLSKRLLIFAEDQVHFHCCAATYCEDTHLENSNPNVSFEFEQEYYFREESKQHNGKSAFQQYCTYVIGFTNREFTFECDILNAFAGVAGLLERELGGLFWGLPERCFGDSLLWSPNSLDLLRPYHRRKLFPSWSWAGWDIEACYSNDLGRAYSTDDTTLWPNILWTRFASDHETLVRIDDLPAASPGPATENSLVTSNQQPNAGTVDLEQQFAIRHGFKAPKWQTLSQLAPRVLLDHLICFETSLACLEIVPLDKEIGSSDKNLRTLVTTNGDYISKIFLHLDWLKDRGPSFDFIVVGHGPDEWKEKFGLLLMMIEWDGGAALRVGMAVEVIQESTWSAANPEWRLIALQ
jgi:hypothetical protein